ncbi:MAG: OmpA family protein [Planctomycetota bacterium]
MKSPTEPTAEPYLPLRKDFAMSVIRTLPLFVLLSVVVVATGCQRPLEERNALYSQNVEAQAEIDRLRMANDRLTIDHSALMAENNQLRTENSRLLAQQGQGNGGGANQRASTGFEDVPDVEIERTATQIAVRVPGDVLFASGEVELKASAQRTLNEIADILEVQYPNNTLRIEGYTDSDPIVRSGWDDNLELSLQRAASVHRYLAQRGISDERMYAAGFGATRLRANKPASRRVEIVVVLQE